MNQALMMMYALGGRMDPAHLRSMIAAGNEKRRKLFTRLAEILFGLVMFFFGDLELKVDKGGTTGAVDAGAAGITTEEKLNALIAGLKQNHKGTIFREFMRPLLITAAEIIADLMAPDEMVVGLLGGGAAGMGGGPLVPGAVPAFPSYGGGAAIPAGGQQGGLSPAQRYEGQNINTEGRPQVWRVINGQRRWIAGPAVFNRNGWDWNAIIKLPASEIDSIPEGAPLN